MYEIRPESIKTFITAGNIQLPRFQRKQTWDAVKNFELCISIFKNYPIGVCILNVDQKPNGKYVRWLLDGRQRRSALTKLYEDPENLYFWAQKFVKFKNNDQIRDLQEKYWEKIHEYLESEEEDVSSSENNEENEEVEEETFEENISGSDDNDIDNTSVPVSTLANGLDLLFEIIRLCHNRSKRGTGFTAPFDIEKFVQRLPFVLVDNGKTKLSSKRLKNFIADYQTYCREESIEYDEEDSFFVFLKSRFEISQERKLKEYIHRNWTAIVERIDILQRIDDLLSTQTIGLIEVKNLKHSDSQKIFNLINTKGSPLKAVEILSARPKWNVIIKSPSAEVKELVNKLYKEEMGIVPEGVVRWDLAATFLRRLNSNIIFKDFTKDNGTTSFEKELTTSFKCLAGIYVKGVTKDSVDQLSEYPINWELDIDALVNDLRTVIKLIESFNYFKFFKTWHTNLMSITSDGIAMNYLILVYKDWIKKGKPIGSNIETLKFQKNCFILWDRLLYEYELLQWKSSSDSKTRNNIESEAEIIPISESEWRNLLTEIFDNSTIGGRDITQGYMEPLLYHLYCLSNIPAPNSTPFLYEVDHILPQSVFSTAKSIERRDVIQDNLLNLALLPKGENISKSKKRLSQIDDRWLINQIDIYEFIPENKFHDFSDIGKYKEMFDYRRPKFIKAFTDSRNYILNN